MAFLRVKVKAPAAFLAQELSFLEELLEHLGRLCPLAKSLVKPLGDLRRHIEPHLIQELKGTHGHAKLLQGLVNRERGKPFLEKAGRLVQIGCKEPVDEEAGAILHSDRNFPQIAGQGLGPLQGFLGSELAAHHLHEGHPVYGIEEMEAYDPLWPSYRHL